MGLTFRINLTLNLFIEKKIDECHYITNIRESNKRYKTLIKLKDNMLIWGEYHKVTQENIMKQIKILCMYQKKTHHVISYLHTKRRKIHKIGASLPSRPGFELSTYETHFSFNA